MKTMPPRKIVYLVQCVVACGGALTLLWLTLSGPRDYIGIFLPVCLGALIAAIIYPGYRLFFVSDHRHRVEDEKQAAFWAQHPILCWAGGIFIFAAAFYLVIRGFF